MVKDNVSAKRSTKEKILEASIDLFSRSGYHGVSIRNITKEVGIKESSLYNHFQNKEEILETIFQVFRNEFKKTLPPVHLLDQILDNSSVEQFFEQGFENIRNHVDKEINEKLWRILYIEHYRDPVAREIFLNDIIAATIDFLEIVFAKLIEKGKIKPFDPKLLAAEYQYPIFSMVSEYNMLRFDNKDTTKIEARMREHMDFFLQMVKA